MADRVLELDTQRFGGAFLVKPLKPAQVLKTLPGKRADVKFERFEERRREIAAVTPSPISFPIGVKAIAGLPRVRNTLLITGGAGFIGSNLVHHAIEHTSHRSSSSSTS